MPTLYIQRFTSFAPILYFLTAIGALVVAGCGDRVLPPDNSGNDGGKTYRIIYNKMVGGSNDGVITVAQDGKDRRDLGIGKSISTPPGGNSIVQASRGDFINIINVNDGSTVNKIPRTYGESIDNMSVAISPDGKKIAYSVNYDDYALDGDGMLVYTRRVVIVNSDGSNPILLDVGAARESYIRFSPNGEQIAFFTAGGNSKGKLYVARTDGSEVHSIADVRMVVNDGYMFFDWSPDGKKIVYSDFEDQSIYIASVDGSAAQHITGGIHPDWSPDGKKILYLSTSFGKIAVMNSDGSGEPESLGVTALQPQWSPDGKKILYCAVVTGLPLDEQPPVMSVMDVKTKQSYVLANDGYYGYWIE